MQSKIILLAACAALVIAVGCGPGNPATAPVSGTVKLEGSPLAGATVQFAPTTEPRHTASAVTDASGNYTLRTFGQADGAVPGPYKVMVTKFEDVEVGVETEGEHKGEPLFESKNLVAEKYSMMEQTPLEFTVKAGEDNNFPIEVTK
jgi:hypothetical protein